MIHQPDDAMWKTTWRLWGVFQDTNPRGLIVAAMVSLPVAVVVWRGFMGLAVVTGAVGPWPVVAAGAFGFTAAAAAAVAVYRHIARRDSPDTPWPTYHLAVWLDERRAPTPAPARDSTHVMRHQAPEEPQVATYPTPRSSHAFDLDASRASRARRFLPHRRRRR